MSDPKDSDPKDKKPDRSAEPTAVGQQGGNKRSGRVAYDSRGNPTWEWQLETGVYSRDLSTQRLKKLDLGDLSIAESAIQKRPEGLTEPAPAAKPKAPLPGGGFNPYDNSSRSEGGNPYDNARSISKKLGPTPPAPVSRKPSDLRKLDAWIKQKKNLPDAKDEK